ncbi:hypothetical protein Ciccas_006681 [Cichlidogyrus casuarinus]|uniref:Uncharacterized protein n=1 Tax=Cichlidogyrus casuarinus TaxID=1844966 RepID=A0ABD2Q646_9PLAT
MDCCAPLATGDFDGLSACSNTSLDVTRRVHADPDTVIDNKLSSSTAYFSLENLVCHFDDFVNAVPIQNADTKTESVNVVKQWWKLSSYGTDLREEDYPLEVSIFPLDLNCVGDEFELVDDGSSEGSSVPGVMYDGPSEELDNLSEDDTVATNSVLPFSSDSQSLPSPSLDLETYLGLEQLSQDDMRVRVKEMNVIVRRLSDELIGELALRDECFTIRENLDAFVALLAASPAESQSLPKLKRAISSLSNRFQLARTSSQDPCEKIPWPRGFAGNACVLSLNIPQTPIDSGNASHLLTQINILNQILRAALLESPKVTQFLDQYSEFIRDPGKLAAIRMRRVQSRHRSGTRMRQQLCPSAVMLKRRARSSALDTKPTSAA